MSFGERVFIYCERGSNGALLAEPLNAASNVAFLIAALVALQLLLRRPRSERSADHYLLIALVFIVGLGSLAFHLFADRGSELADVIPIGLFMLVYLGFALHRFLDVPIGWTVLLVAGFAGLIATSMQVQCWNGAFGFPGAAVTDAGPCLNGSLGYFPALGAMILIGLLLAARGGEAAPWILWAAAVFAVSITFRSLDIAVCPWTVVEGHRVGTHFLWHILNAVTLFLLLRASLCVGAEARNGRKLYPA